MEYIKLVDNMNEIIDKAKIKYKDIKGKIRKLNQKKAIQHHKEVGGAAGAGVDGCFPSGQVAVFKTRPRLCPAWSG